MTSSVKRMSRSSVRPPDVAAQPTDDDTDDRGEGYGDDAHRHGHPCAIDDAGKYISPNLIGTEDVPAIWGGIDFA